MTVAGVHLWGTRIGAVVWDAERELGAFEYDPDFLPSGIEVAPLTMPLGGGVFRFPGLPRETYRGLPGLLSDVLPDRFGNALIDSWLAAEGRTPDSFDPVERLCYTGARGIGALEFQPELGEFAEGSRPLEVARLTELADAVLRDRESFVERLRGGDEQAAMRSILRVGTSAGGARAKALIAWNPDTGEVRSGQVDGQPGFSPWLLKFDGMTANRDHDAEPDPPAYGRIEFAYAHMARAAGIRMSECRLLEEGGRAHFVTRRFDRPTDEAGRESKLHMQSLCALGHHDFNLPGGTSYEQLFQLMQRLGLGRDAALEQFRRIAFNVLARNQDDHTKNVAFLMNKRGEWSLSPAFDLTYAYAPSGAWTARHQMSLCGKRDGFTREDFRELGRFLSFKRGRADALLEEVSDAVAGWRGFASDAGVPERVAEAIASHHRRLPD